MRKSALIPGKVFFILASILMIAGISCINNENQNSVKKETAENTDSTFIYRVPISTLKEDTVILNRIDDKRVDTLTMKNKK